MANQNPFSGRVGWIDLTVPSTEDIRDFYAEVLGLRPQPVDMGEYSDFNLISPETGQPVAGICHPKGPNADLPAVWLVYFTVPDLEDAMKIACRTAQTDKIIIFDGCYGDINLSPSLGAFLIAMAPEISQNVDEELLPKWLRQRGIDLNST